MNLLPQFLAAMFFAAACFPREARHIASSAPSSIETSRAAAACIRGRTIRWTWAEGPTAGVTHEHVFRSDGTVEWRVLNGPQEGRTADEKEYRAFAVADNVCAASYLGASGYTLTVVLNFATGHIIGFASGEAFWAPARGTFEVVR